MKKEVTTTQAQNPLARINELPNLHEKAVSFRELSSEYWTPEEKGEYKVGVIMDVKEETYNNNETGEDIMLPCIIMLAQNEDSTFRTIRNGAKRLVATVESAIENGSLILGETPVKIEYLGKQRNKTNSFSSDKFSVKPIII